uniref:Uncharacterized protein n=1 Tax=Panagrellus redivivus TaxID=6233 RepID=A0A7E4VBQ8_PANRE
MAIAFLAISCLLIFALTTDAKHDSTFRAHDGHWTNIGVFLFSLITLFTTVVFVTLTFFAIALIDCKCCKKKPPPTSSGSPLEMDHAEKGVTDSSRKKKQKKKRPLGSQSSEDTMPGKHKNVWNDLPTSSGTHSDRGKKAETDSEKEMKENNTLTQLISTSLFKPK